MAKILLREGFDLTVHNRSQDKVEEMIALGAKSASSTAEIVETTDTLLACRPDALTAEQVLLGADGIVPNAGSGRY